ncbi:MAG: siderophore-interacting protein [Rhodococcus sp. (in: high G+C Gram-positive bacteria)]|nr:siderophore-interacting protein [Rhodococcus sp. (in: high G+C Gram-positive bacteria)]
MSWSFATVAATWDLSPRMRRVRMRLSDPERVVLPGSADEAYGLYFPNPGEPSNPMELRNGIWDFYDIEPAPSSRNYSVRAHDRVTSTIDIDFVNHHRGVATTWAQNASVGDRIVVSHPRSWYQPEEGSDWQMLVADLAGLPAMARIIEELDPATPAVAIVEVSDVADLEYLPIRDNVTVIPTVGTGNGHGPSALPDLVAAQPIPSGRGYCWFAAEAVPSRAVRKYFRREHGWPADQFDIIGYWRFDSEVWDAKFEKVSDALVAVYAQALAAGKGDKIASEEFDEALERAGL